MSTINLTGPTTTTGSTVLLTSPTYTFVPGIAKDFTTRAYTLSALGGTQSGVYLHSNYKPKEVIFKRFKDFQRAAKYNTVTGKFGIVPKNTVSVIGRGGLSINANQVELGNVRIDFSIPAGAETYASADTEALMLMTLQATINQLPAILDAVRSGVI